MKTEILKNDKKSKKSAGETEMLDSTRMLFKNGPKVPGAFTGINFQKIKRDKKKRPARG